MSLPPARSSAAGYTETAPLVRAMACTAIRADQSGAVEPLVSFHRYLAPLPMPSTRTDSTTLSTIPACMPPSLLTSANTVALPSASLNATRATSFSDEHDSFENISSQDVTLTLTGRGYNVDNVGGEVPGGYEQMTAANIRKLCSQRGIRMPPNARKGERIQRLREYDAAAPALLQALGRPQSASTSSSSNRPSLWCSIEIGRLLETDWLKSSVECACMNDFIADCHATLHLSVANQIHNFVHACFMHRNRGGWDWP